MKERRKVHRRTLDFEVTCYIDGARLEAHALDISAGGVFVGTDMARPVPIGALAGLVFVSETAGISTTFLFGRVVRKQDEPVRGFAVEWEKAVSAGSSDELSVFLEQLLGLAAPSVELEAIGSSSATAGLTRSVFRFPTRIPGSASSSGGGSPRNFEDESFVDIPFVVDTDSAEAKPEDGVEGDAPDFDASPAASVAPVAPDVNISFAPPPVASESTAVPSDSEKIFDDLQFCFENLDVSDEEISLVQITPGLVAQSGSTPTKAAEAHVKAAVHGRAGQVSSVVEKSDAIMPCAINGILTLRGVRLPVAITQIGLTAAFISSPFVPADDTEKLELSFFIGTKRGEALLKCHGRMVSDVPAREPGFKVVFSKLDEGASPGILRRYLKWLHFNSVAGT